MRKLVSAALVVVVVIVMLLNIAAIYPDAHEKDTIFYDETVREVVGIEAEASSLWMLSDGEYQIVTHDGECLTVLVANGSWQYIQ